MTIHKSQGSEYDVVVIPMTTSHFMMLKRNLLYTAITRAKKLCIIVGTKRALQRAINTLDGTSRQTGLLSRIRSEEHTSELQSLMRTSYAVFCLKKKKPLTIKLYAIHTNITHSKLT